MEGSFEFKRLSSSNAIQFITDNRPKNSGLKIESRGKPILGGGNDDNAH
jgi:hypothetical protein